MKAEIFNNNGWVKETNPEVLKNHFSDLLYMAKFDVLNFVEHYFTPHGYTALWLLGESHLAIHTFPEAQRTYFELASCNEQKHIMFMANIQMEVVNE